MGGVHGNNRLGGNSLLDCVVYGRVAGKTAADYLYKGKTTHVDLNVLCGKKPILAVSKAGMSAVATAGVAPGTKLSLDEVAKHATKEDCWVVIDGKVLDVTKFLPDHPG